METIKELELDLIVKEALIQQLKYKNEMLREEIASVYEDIIDKAIDYIENCHGMYRNTIGDIQPMINIKPVLEILKGVDKE